MARCFPAKTNRVSALLPPEIAQLHLGLYSNFNRRNTGKQAAFSFFLFFVMNVMSDDGESGE
jgi:hypothetical protein